MKNKLGIFIYIYIGSDKTNVDENGKAINEQWTVDGTKVPTWGKKAILMSLLSRSAIVCQWNDLIPVKLRNHNLIK